MWKKCGTQKIQEFYFPMHLEWSRKKNNENIQTRWWTKFRKRVFISNFENLVSNSTYNNYNRPQDIMNIFIVMVQVKCNFFFLTFNISHFLNNQEICIQPWLEIWCYYFPIKHIHHVLNNKLHYFSALLNIFKKHLVMFGSKKNVCGED